MTPNFALSLSPDRLRLMQRADAGWLLVGEIVLPTPHLRTEMSELRARGEALNGGPFTTKLLIPNEQIRYLTLGDPEAGEAEVRAALEGATPYPVADLAYDHSRGGGRTYVAAVARETLAEAEAFAREHRMNPVSFAASPEPFTFAGEPVFGPSSDAKGRVTRDPDPVRVVGVARLPVPPVRTDAGRTDAGRTDAGLPTPELVEAAPAPPTLSFQRSRTVEPPPPELVGLTATELPRPEAATQPAAPQPAATAKLEPAAPRPKAQAAERKPKAAAKTPVAEPGPGAETTPALTDRTVDFQTRLRARIAEQGLDKRLPRSAVPRAAFQDEPPPAPNRPPRRSWREALRAAKGEPLSDDPPGTPMPAPTVAFRHAAPAGPVIAGAAAIGAARPTRAEPRISFGAQALKETAEPPPVVAPVSAPIAGPIVGPTAGPRLTAQPKAKPAPGAVEPEAGAATAREAVKAAGIPWTQQLSRDTSPAPVPPAPPLRATNAPPAELTFELAERFPEPERRPRWLLLGVLTLLLVGALGLVGSLATGGSDGLARLLGRGEAPETVASVDPAEAVPVGEAPEAVASAEPPAGPELDPAASAEPQTGDIAEAPEVPAAPPVEDTAETRVPDPANEPASDPASDLAAAVANSVRALPEDSAPDPFEVLAETLAASDSAPADAEVFVPAAPQIDVPAGLTLAPGATDSGAGLAGTDSAPSFSVPLAVAPGAGGESSGVEAGTTQSAAPPQAAAPVIGAAAVQPVAPALSGEPSGLGALDGVALGAAPGGLTVPGGLADRSRPEVDSADPAPPEPEVAEVLEAPPILPAEPLGRVLSPAEAERIYAATGVWQRAPRLPVTPRTEAAAELTSGATEALDEVPRPGAPGLDVVASFDSPLPAQVNPPPAGTVFERDDRGFVIATAEGSATPDGILVYAGTPPLEPPIRPGTVPPPFDPASLAESAGEVTDTGAAIVVAARLQTRVPVRPGSEAPVSATEVPEPVATAEAPAAEAPGETGELSAFMAALGNALAEEVEGSAAPQSDTVPPAATTVALLDSLPQRPPTRPATVGPAAAGPETARAETAVLATAPVDPPTRTALPEPPDAPVALETVPGNRLDSLPARPPSRPASVVRALASAPAPETAPPVAEALPAEPRAPLSADVQRLPALPIQPILRPAGISTRATVAPASAALGAPIVNPPTRPATLASAPAVAAPQTPAPEAEASTGVQRLDRLPLRPPSRPASEAAPPADTAPAPGATEDSPLLFLDRAAVRPQPRPGSSNEDLASSTLAALTRTQPAASATPGAVTLEALLRPASRPEPPATAASPEPGGLDLAESLRPQARPGDVAAEAPGTEAGAQAQAEITSALAAAALALENSVPPSATATAQAVSISPRPDERPRNMASIVQRARAETARLAARQQTQAPAAAPPRTVQPSGTTTTTVASAATQDGAINLGRMNLIGVAGSDSDRRALIRLSNGRYLRVGVGDSLDGGQVQSIGDDTLTYVRGGRAVRLDMPG